ncbi:hypothetical protein [Peribacillus glennii]|uniref:Uncharacterized protein n=1 Tax=Peribacillus glennii TaxID=2303991 RepID=A0A372LFH4_9BACI|nr:hypothetical protein [Peribacillus glennii]RFU65073.1 hypothetical protein D0466_03935 [Peribacillus glennii]
MDIKLSMADNGLTDVIMNVEGIDYEIGMVEEHPTAEGYYRAYSYDGALLQSSEYHYAFADFEQAISALLDVYQRMQDKRQNH